MTAYLGMELIGMLMALVVAFLLKMPRLSGPSKKQVYIAGVSGTSLGTSLRAKSYIALLMYW